MKKFLLLLVLCVIKLSAYDYIIQDNTSQSRFYSNDNIFGLYNLNKSTNGVTRIAESTAYVVMSNLRIYSGQSIYGYIEVSQFMDYYKNDLFFLNDLYTKEYYNVFLNFLYNNDNFSSSNYINYTDYQILYNSDGLAVASIVNGQWAGLYDNSTMGSSGNLYNSNGSLVYVDGREPSFFQKLWVKLSVPLMKDLMDANSGLMPLKWILAFIIIFMLVYFCIRLYKNVMGVEKWKI